MDDPISKYEKRNRPTRRAERFILKIMVFIVIPINCILVTIYPTIKMINSLPVLFSLAGLLQLEVAGLFEYINHFSDSLEKIYDESGRVPSYITRAIFEYYNPESTITALINNNLYLNKRVGFYLLLIGGLIQLLSVWFV